MLLRVFRGSFLCSLRNDPRMTRNNTSLLNSTFEAKTAYLRPFTLGYIMDRSLQTLIPCDLPQPLGPYSHIAKAGQLITISAIAGMEPETGKIVGQDAYSQAKQILRLCDVMLAAAESDLDHVVHMNLFLKNVEDLDDVTRACDEALGPDRPAGTVIAVPDLPKPGALVTMSLIAMTREAS